MRQETAEAVVDLVVNKTLNKNQVDNAKDLKIVTLMHNLIEYIDNYAKYKGVYSSITRMF